MDVDPMLPMVGRNCSSCGELFSRCLRVIGAPLRGYPLWTCEECWHPKGDVEEAEYRRRFAIPTPPHIMCSLCGKLAPVEGILAALLLDDRVKPAERIAESQVPQRQRPDLGEIPRRRSYPLGETRILLGMSLSKLKEELRDDKISFVRVGKRRHILDAEINRYLLRNPGKRKRAATPGRSPRVRAPLPNS